MARVAKGMKRRDFLMLTAGAAAALAAPPGYLFIEEQVRKVAARATGPSSESHEWTMLIDQTQCIGCNRCTWACKAVNDFPGDIWWNVVYTQGPRQGTAAGTLFLPRPCMMCKEPPCVDVCPVQATYKRAGDGLVVMDHEKCIGCRYCMAACPYGARYFNWKAPDGGNDAIPLFGQAEVPRRPRGVVEKCTFCQHRIDAGLAKGLKPGVKAEATPACVVVCPVPARFFGDLKEGKVYHPTFGERSASSFTSKAVKLKEELGTNPRVLYLPPGA